MVKHPDLQVSSFLKSLIKQQSHRDTYSQGPWLCLYIIRYLYNRKLIKPYPLWELMKNWAEPISDNWSPNLSRPEVLCNLYNTSQPVICCNWWKWDHYTIVCSFRKHIKNLSTVYKLLFVGRLANLKLTLVRAFSSSSFLFLTAQMFLKCHLIICLAKWR